MNSKKSSMRVRLMMKASSSLKTQARGTREERKLKSRSTMRKEKKKWLLQAGREAPWDLLTAMKVVKMRGVKSFPTPKQMKNRGQRSEASRRSFPILVSRYKMMRMRCLMLILSCLAAPESVEVRYLLEELAILIIILAIHRVLDPSSQSTSQMNKLKKTKEMTTSPTPPTTTTSC